MIILGINAYHGDASAALLVDGQLVAAVEEERFTRVKHTAGFPTSAIQYCLRTAGAALRDVDHIAIPRDPWARWLRKMAFAVRLPRFALDRARIAGRFGRVADELVRALDADPAELSARVHRVEHLRAHIASSFFVSPFERAALLSLDGLGDFASGMWGVGDGNRMRVMGSIAFPHSLGIYYTALTQYLGFWKYGDEYKVMGLAAYGEPEYLDDFRLILRVDSGVGYALDLRYFTHHRTGPSMTWGSGEPVLGRLFSDALVRRLGPAREPRSGVERHHENLAATLQARLEEVVFHSMTRLHEVTGLTKLAYAGGVAFNCLANGRALDRTPFERFYIQPAAGDAGLAIGAALYVWHEVLGRPRGFVMDHAYWGPGYAEDEIRRSLEARGVGFRRLEQEPLLREVAKHIADGKVVGWFQGRAEWGPRALGNRSILVDPRQAEMKEVLNRRIKRREPFRPFAPSILEERTGEWFESTHPSPFMQLTYRVRPERRSLIPAPTHVDGTGRLQTVSRQANPLYWNLLSAFEDLTGVPVLLNTSFNENEPIVNTPDEAIECFLRTRMDVLAIGPFMVDKR